MPTKNSYSGNKIFIFFICILFFGFNTAYAQCPTVVNASQTFCDVQSPTVADLVAVDNGNGVVWYATTTSTIPLSNSAGLISGQTYFADDNSGSCGTRQSVQVTVYSAPIGQNFQGVCVDIASDATIADLIATGNNVQWYDVPMGGTPLSSTTILNDNTIYYASQTNPNTGCVTSRLSVFVNVGVVPTPVGNPNQQFCNNPGNPPTVADLVASGNNNWYLTETSALPLPLSTPLVNGQDYFATTIDPPCESDTRLQVTVTILEPNNPGTNGVKQICQAQVATTPPFNLFDQLGGNPDNTGTWTGPLPTSNGSLGTVNVSTLTVAGSPYVFTYTVSSLLCSAATSTVTIIITPAPNAGTSNSLTLCSNSPSQNLFNSLGGNPQAGGVWSPPLASGTGVFNPAIDPAGVYTYTVTGISPCANATATITVTVTPLPNAGTSTSLSLCSNSSPQNLFLLLGSAAQTGGTWSPPLASGTGVFNPLVDAPGLYTYTLTGTPPCSSVSATVNVTVAPQPNAGTNGALTLCSNAAPQNLFLSLGGNPQSGGVWSPALASGTGVFNPAIDPSGVYTYTVNGIAPCVSSTATVTVTVEPLPNAGTSGNLTLCSNSGPQDLFLSLGGSPQPGGTWSPALASGTSIYNPLVDPPGIYTYTTAPSQSCGQSASATVNVTVTTVVNAGGDGVANLCPNGPSVNLFTFLTGNPQSGGVWTPALASGTGIFNPAVDPAGIYTYSLSNSCGNDSATVTVNISPVPNAGGSGASLLISACMTSTSVNLNTALNGSEDPGIWSDDDNTGALNNNIFNPSLVGPGTYHFTYTVASTNPLCSSQSVTVTVIVSPLANAGTFTGIQNLCNSQANVDLFTLLTGYLPGGVWTDSNGQTVSNPVSIINLPAATYSYTYTVSNACGVDSETVQFTVVFGPNVSGTQISANSVCLNSSNEVLITGANNLADGTYIIEYVLSGASSVALSATVSIVGGNGSFTIPATALNNPGSVTVTVSQVFSDGNSCGSSGNSIAPVTFQVIDLGVPGIIPAGNEFCVIDKPTIANLSANITGDLPVVWYDAPVGGTAYNDTDLLVNGTTYYAGYATASGCESSSRLEVTVDLTKCPILIPDGFSPNGDNINDEFVINNINIVYPNFDLEIYNRYGNLIYKGNATTPNWNGTATAGGTKLGDGVLPVGVYFFILNFNDNATAPMQGRIYLSR